MYKQTTATTKLAKLDKRIRAVSGGTAASKTISILLILIHRAQKTPNKLISIVSESFPHLKRGAIRDFLNIMETHGYFKESRWNKTDFIYTFETGTKIEFFSADQADKVRGPRRDILFINEANNIPLETFNQLEVRTRDVIWMDWNPTNEFWFYTDVKNSREKDINFITLTYKDNEALEQSIIDSIEARRDNKNWWRVYGEGKLGEFEGKIYQDWQIIDEIPHAARLEGYGLDFGYSADPAAIVAVYYHDGGYILDEVLYATQMSNQQLADVLKAQKTAMVVADSAEPKSIDAIKMQTVPIYGAEKGSDSVRNGISVLQGERISMTKHSVNLISEYRGYMWKTDKNGTQLPIPESTSDHLLDAARYLITMKKGVKSTIPVKRDPAIVRRKARYV